MGGGDADAASGCALAGPAPWSTPPRQRRCRARPDGARTAGAQAAQTREEKTHVNAGYATHAAPSARTGPSATSGLAWALTQRNTLKVDIAATGTALRWGTR